MGLTSLRIRVRATDLPGDQNGDPVMRSAHRVTLYHNVHNRSLLRTLGNGSEPRCITTSMH
jgi:hypothetical protein